MICKVRIQPTVQAALDTLRSRSVTDTSGREYGVSIKKDPVTGDTTGTAVPPSNGGDSLTIHLDENTFAIAHDHRVTTKGVGPPSAADFYDIGEDAIASKGRILESAVVIGSDTYMLVVNDPTAFNKFLKDYPKATNLETDTNSPNYGNFVTGSPMQVDFFNDVSGVYRATNPRDKQAAVAAGLAYVLNKYNTGISLMKADSSGDLHVISSTTTTSGGVTTYQAGPCPNYKHEKSNILFNNYGFCSLSESEKNNKY